MLDAAALRIVGARHRVDSPQAGLCIRSGYLALREIADFFGFENDHDPAPDDPITITREEFDEVYERLGAAGCPCGPTATRRGATSRAGGVNYDAVLTTLAGLVMAPYGPWTSDRSVIRR